VFCSAGPLDLIRTDSWVYDACDYLKTAGCIQTLPSQSRPWTREYTVRLVREAVTGSGSRAPRGLASHYLTRLLGEFQAEFPDARPPRGLRAHRPLVSIPVDSSRALGFDLFDRVRADTSNQRASLGARFQAQTSERFTALSRMELIMFRKSIANMYDSSGFLHVPGFREHVYRRQGVFDIPEAYLRFRIPWLELDIGRQYEHWGPGYRSSTALSTTAPSLDLVRLTGDYRRFKLCAFTAALSPWQNRQRFLSAQRLEVNLWDRVLLAPSLHVVHSLDPSSAQTKDLFGYINPLIPLYPEIANAGHDDNGLVALDVTGYLPYVKLYAQVMADNFEADVYNPVTPPNAIAWQAGLLALPLPDMTLRYEYARVTNFTYYHRIPFIAYTNFDVPLGHTLGPDADEHFAELAWHPWIWGSAALRGTFTRRGDRNRGDWTNRVWIPGDSTKYNVPEFPTGVVEQTLSIGPSLILVPNSWLRLTGEFAWNWTSNFAGATGDSRTAPTFDCRLEFRY
jgi:hypothetical protein